MTVHLYSPERTVQFLQARIEDGWLSSRYDQYVNKKIRRTDSSYGTFYTNTLKERGLEAAEAELVEWNAEGRMSDYAALIEPVAEGMLTMAKADPESVKMFDIDADDRRVPRHYMMHDGKAIVLINRSAPGCGCMQPQGTSVFGPWGRIGIKAIVLSLDNYNPAHTQLGIVLPIRGRDNLQPGQRKSGFTVATVDLDGHTNGETNIPDVEDSEYLMKMLGLADGPIPRGMSSMGGHFDDAVGFPGATDYLANQLPRLKEYFAALAEKLTGEHKH